MEQGSEKWLAWRRKGLGGSDAGQVLGVSPWGTKYELWLDKIGRYHRVANRFITEKGHKYEDRARALFQVLEGFSYPPRLAVSQFYDYMRVSLDGWCEELQRPLEIKFQGKKEHKRVGLYKKLEKRWEGDHTKLVWLQKNVRKFIPEKYWPQIQYQMLVTEAKDCVFLSYNNQVDEIEWIVVRADRPYQVELLSKMKAFWCENILKNIRPELTVKDFLLIEETQILDEIYEVDRAIKAQEQELKQKRADLEKIIKKATEQYDHPHVRNKNGVLIKKLKSKYSIRKEEVA